MNILVVMMIPALAFVMFVRTLIFQPFDVPSTSMAPNLNEGDKFFVA